MSMRTSKVGAGNQVLESGAGKRVKRVSSSHLEQGDVEKLDAAMVAAHRYQGDGTQEFFPYENQSHLNELEDEAEVFVEDTTLLKTLVPNALLAVEESGAQEDEASQSKSEKIKHVAEYDKMNAI